MTAQIGVILSLPDPKIVLIGRGRIALPAPQPAHRRPARDALRRDHARPPADPRLAERFAHRELHRRRRHRAAAALERRARVRDLRRRLPPALRPTARAGRHAAAWRWTSRRRRSSRCAQSRTSRSRATACSWARASRWARTWASPTSAATSQFDALVIFTPHIAFMVDVGNRARRARPRRARWPACTSTFTCQVPLRGAPRGTRKSRCFWTSVPIDVGPFTWGDADNPLPAPADPRQLARDAIHHNPGAWQALVPPDADRVVRLKAAPPSDVEVTVHPMGMFDVRQHAVPLETVIVRVGANPVPEGQRRVHFGVPLVDGVAGRGAERSHRSVLGGQLPRSVGRREAVAPEFRADARRGAHPLARRSGELRRVARGRSALRDVRLRRERCGRRARQSRWRIDCGPARP